MHPARPGHQLLAREMAEQLRRRGWNLGLPGFVPADKASQSKEILWLIRNGLPWFLKRSVDLLPVAVLLMAIEFLRVLREFVLQTR